MGGIDAMACLAKGRMYASCTDSCGTACARFGCLYCLLPGVLPYASRDQVAGDYSHFGFALESCAAVDAIAAKARTAGYLVWEPRQEPYPVGYYCGVRDPDGNMVEFSYGQPLGPGAPEAV
jgi:catechol 2,3-dioxygenase-like lactoylglutathione lyase family enzyme